MRRQVEKKGGVWLGQKRAPLSAGYMPGAGPRGLYSLHPHIGLDTVEGKGPNTISFRQIPWIILYTTRFRYSGLSRTSESPRGFAKKPKQLSCSHYPQIVRLLEWKMK